MTNPTPVDSLEFRRTLGAFATGVTIISILDAAGKPRGMTVNSFSSVSLEPPLILWNLGLNTPDFAVFQAAERFAVNILAEGQRAISDRFAFADIAARFDGVPVSAGLGGVPLLDGCVAVLECLTETVYPGGDHLIILGRVERLHRYLQAPLLFFDGQYRTVGRSLAP